MLSFTNNIVFYFVRLTGLEPARRGTLDPKSSASTSSATGAKVGAKIRNNLLFSYLRFTIYLLFNNFSMKRLRRSDLYCQCVRVEDDARTIDEGGEFSVIGKLLWGAKTDAVGCHKPQLVGYLQR